VSHPERAGGATARSTHIAVLGAVAWPDIAARLSPALARVDAGEAKAQCLVIVPASADVTDLAYELNAHLAPREIRVVPLATPRLAKRIVASAGAQVLISTPEGVTALLAASALALDALAGIGICAADDLEGSEAALDQVLAETSRDTTKVLTAGKFTPFVERVLDRHMHGARRVTATIPASAVRLPQVEVVAVTSSAPLAPLADILEAADAPSVGILAADARRADATRDALTRLGQGAESRIARVLSGGETGVSLLVLAGAAKPAAIASACATPPARVVALVTARERAALSAALPGARFVPFALGAARTVAQAAESQMRDRIRATLLEGLPAREMLALEPLLADADPLAVAGALLRLYERERDGHRRTREARAEAESRPPRAPADRAPHGLGDHPRGPRGDGSDRPPRKFDRDRPRSFDRPRPSGRDDRRGPPRSRGEQADRGPRRSRDR
jgi:hypothetical protein